MNRNNIKLFLSGCGCANLIFYTLIVVVLFLFTVVGNWSFVNTKPQATQINTGFEEELTPQIAPTLIKTEIPPAAVGTPVLDPSVSTEFTPVSSDYLNQFYELISPGVVSVYVFDTDSTQGGTGTGSGFIFDSTGNIVTNNHVIRNADLVMVTFHDGTQEKAEIVGVDPDSDLAVIKVKVGELPDSVKPLPIANLETVMPGDWVIALGNPFGLNSSMTLGIISAIGRVIPSGATPFAIPSVIQTDTAINPGNSGGPLLNLEGQVIGVNAQIVSESGANSGVGFSIPADILARVVPSLIEVGVYQWPWLGVRGTGVDLFIEEANDLTIDRGAYLIDVLPESPADLAGLRGGSEVVNVDGIDVPIGGDIIIEADEIPITSYIDLQVYIARNTPGTTVEFTVLREGELMQIPVELEPRPEP